MEFSYLYPGPSVCLSQDDKFVLGLSPDLSRKEKVSFVGTLKNPLVYRDAMLVLRQVVISDMRKKQKNREAFFQWLTQEVNRQTLAYQDFLPEKREKLYKDMSQILEKLKKSQDHLKELQSTRTKLQKALEKHDVWADYRKIEREFWNYIRERDKELWFVLDPVITVHPDQVSFEAFSLDESSYGCLVVDKDEFEIKGTPQLGTTNIDFSAQLGLAIERFRSYNKVELSINPNGFVVESGITPKHIEKKIDLPESWIKGFTQVSTAASLSGLEISLTSADMYSIILFLKRHKAHQSPRAMIWECIPNQRIKIKFQPWNKEITLSTIFHGNQTLVEKIWGSRRWLILERLLPIAKSFKIKLLGFGLPQFISANLGSMTLILGFTSWSSNDWSRGTAFNILSGFIGEGKPDVMEYLQQQRFVTFPELQSHFPSLQPQLIRSSLGQILRRGEAYYDLVYEGYRYRKLSSVPLPAHLYEITKQESQVLELLGSNKLQETKVEIDLSLNILASTVITEGYQKFQIQVLFNSDGQITKVMCTCSEFRHGARNVSEPCIHLLALFIASKPLINIPKPVPSLSEKLLAFKRNPNLQSHDDDEDDDNDEDENDDDNEDVDNNEDENDDDDEDVDNNENDNDETSNGDDE